MANNDDNESIDIPTDPEKVIFAEGLVNYVLQTNSLSGIVNLLQEEGETDIVICDKTMRMAVGLDNNKVRPYTAQAFEFIMERNLNNIADFATYAVVVRKAHFGYKPSYKAFLHYCIHLAQVGGKLYAQGFKEATIIAIMYIVKEMTFDMARFENKITDMIADECRGQSIYNIVLYRQHEELGYGQHTNSYNVSSSSSSSSSSDIGVPGSSGTEPTNLNSHSSDSDEDENRHRKKHRLHDNI